MAGKEQALMEKLRTQAQHQLAVHPSGILGPAPQEIVNRLLKGGGTTQKYIWPWMRMVCRSERLLHQLPRRIAAKQVL